MKLLDAILREFRRPYGYAGMVMTLGALLVLGGILYKLPEWLSALIDWMQRGMG